MVGRLALGSPAGGPRKHRPSGKVLGPALPISQPPSSTQLTVKTVASRARSAQLEGPQEGWAELLPLPLPSRPPIPAAHPPTMADAALLLRSAPPTRRPSVSSSPSLPLRRKSPTAAAQNKNKKGSVAAPQPPPLPLLKIEAASERGVECGLPGRGVHCCLQPQHFLGAWQSPRWRRGIWRGPRRDNPPPELCWPDLGLSWFANP